MICSGCGRPCNPTGDVCSGCRTVSRIRFLWGNQLGPPEDIPALSILRVCAGELTDLAESRSGRIAREKAEQAPPAEPVRPVEPRAPEKVPKKSREPKAKEEAVESREKGNPLPPEGTAEVKKGEDKGGEDVYSYYEESEEEEIEVEGEDPPRKEPVVPAEEVTPTRRLGLTTIGTRLSAPTPETVEGVRAEGERSHTSRRREEERPRDRIERKSRHDELGRQRTGGAQSSRPPEPRGPPPGLHHRHRDRSRTPLPHKKKKKKRKSKGVAHRERGKEYFRSLRSGYRR